MAIAKSILEHENPSQGQVTHNQPIVKFKGSKLEIYKITILLSVIVMLILIIAYLILIPPTECQKLTSSLPDSGKIETENIYHIISRDEWLARPSIEPMDNLVLPVHRVIIAHTATQNCSTEASCTHSIHTIQNFHMDSRNFNDIIYNFLIGGDGSIYEGRGWNIQGAHTKGFNVDSICIAFIGTFSTLKPPEKQLNASKWMLDEGVKLNKLVKDYKLYGARQLAATESPGSALYETIKNWPNWSNM